MEEKRELNELGIPKLTPNINYRANADDIDLFEIGVLRGHQGMYLPEMTREELREFAAKVKGLAELFTD